MNILNASSNTKMRLISSFILIGLLFSTLLLGPSSFMTLVFLALVLAYLEFSSIRIGESLNVAQFHLGKLFKTRFLIFVFLMLSCGIIFHVNDFYLIKDVLFLVGYILFFLSILLTVILMLNYSLKSSVFLSFEKVEPFTRIFFYYFVPTLLLLNFCSIMNLISHSHWQSHLLVVIGTVAINDSMAWLVGKKMGRHLLLPKISPKKTWEGFFGGFLSSILFYFILRETSILGFASLSALNILVLSCGASAISCFGDFVESFYKRIYGVKDSSNLIPGHGGVLDRIDSLLFLMPYYHLIVIFHL